MAVTLKRYKSSKFSGIDWIGRIPAHWDVVPGKVAYRIKKVSNLGLQESKVLSLSYGQIRVKPKSDLHGLVPRIL